MGKICLSRSRILKLTNVLIYRINTTDEQLQLEVEKMQSYIRVKGTKQVGPLVQYMNTYIDEDGEINIEITLLLQCNSYIHNTDHPYYMESVLKINNCMYCRYIGPEEQICFAYDKIKLEAFEEDIPLKGDSYTIFVDRDEENETITADVFMERAD